MRTIVYKLGGSLLSVAELACRLRDVLALPALSVPSCGEPAMNRLIVVGGGEAADLVRRWDDVHRLGDNRAHDLALQAMTFNAHFVAALLSGSRIVACRAEAHETWSRGGVAVLATDQFLHAEESESGRSLPRSWAVTSDSISAHVALVWPADGLVLIKSLPLPAGCAAQAAGCGAVDAHFPRLACRLPSIGWVNLRADLPAIEPWLNA